MFIREKNSKGFWLAAAAVVTVFILSGIYFRIMDKSDNLTADLPANDQKIIQSSSTGTTLNGIQSEVAREEAANSSPLPLVNNQKSENKIAESKSKPAEEDTQPARSTGENLKTNNGINAVLAHNVAEAEPSIVEDRISREDEKDVFAAMSVPPAKNKSEIADSTVVTLASEKTNVRSQPSSSGTVESSGYQKQSYKDEKIDQKLNETSQLIEHKKYKEANSESRTLLAKHPDNMQINYYAGLSHFHLNEFTEAVQYFDIILNKNDEKLYEDARWYKAQSLAKMNDKTNARKILSRIIGEKSSYKKQAEKLLEQMDGN